MKPLPDRCWEYRWRRCYLSRRTWKRFVRVYELADKLEGVP